MQTTFAIEDYQSKLIIFIFVRYRALNFSFVILFDFPYYLLYKNEHILNLNDRAFNLSVLRHSIKLKKKTFEAQTHMCNYNYVNFYVNNTL